MQESFHVEGGFQWWLLCPNFDSENFENQTMHETELFLVIVAVMTFEKSLSKTFRWNCWLIFENSRMF